MTVASAQNSPRRGRSPAASTRTGPSIRSGPGSTSPAPSLGAGKRSFKPGGIYEIAPPEAPGPGPVKATVMGSVLVRRQTM